MDARCLQARFGEAPILMFEVGVVFASNAATSAGTGALIRLGACSGTEPCQRTHKRHIACWCQQQKHSITSRTACSCCGAYQPRMSPGLLCSSPRARAR